MDNEPGKNTLPSKGGPGACPASIKRPASNIGPSPRRRIASNASRRSVRPTELYPFFFCS